MYTVTLSHAANPDIAGGYWGETIDPKRAVKVTVSSLEEASKVCRAYIERNGLGGGNWTGGKILGPQNHVYGRVAFNGRIFTDQGMTVLA